MDKEALFSPTYLRTLMRYSPITGELTWNPRSISMFTDGVYTAERNMKIWNTRYANQPALHSEKRGKLGGTLGGRHLSLHRVAWAIHFGEWPKGIIDHINGDYTDNRLTNLRVATLKENAQNARRSTANTSGHIGVSYNRRRDKWRSYIKTDHKTHWLGEYKSFDDAVAARKAAQRALGFHPNHGR